MRSKFDMTPVAATMSLVQLLPDGLHVRHLDVIGLGHRGGAGVGVVGEDDVGTDTLDLLQDVVAAGEGDGDDED